MSREVTKPDSQATLLWWIVKRFHGKLIRQGNSCLHLLTMWREKQERLSEIATKVIDAPVELHDKQLNPIDQAILGHMDSE